jgi:hypothetical protein
VSTPEHKRGRGRPRGTHDLNTLNGVVKETADVIRLMKARAIDLTLGKAIVWALSMQRENITAAKIVPMLEEMEAKGAAIDVSPEIMTWPSRQLNS